MRGMLVAGLLALAAMAACSPESTSPPAAGTPQTRPSSTAELGILEPTPGQVVEGSEVLVRLELTGARITEQVTTRLAPDEGHVHLKLDGMVVTLLGGLEERLTGLTPGPHLLEVEFVAADHGPFTPRVIRTATFTVR